MSKKCKQCGCELEDDALFCVQCGAKQDPVVKCPKCGHVNPAGNDFCTECGTRLKEAEPAEKTSEGEKPAVEPQEATAENTKVVVAEPVTGGQGGGGNGGFQSFQMPPVPPEDRGKKKKILASIVNSLKTGDFVNVKGKCVGIVKQKSPTLISVQIKSTKINDQDAD